MKKFVITSIAGTFLLVPLIGIVSAVNTTKNSYSWYQSIRKSPSEIVQRQDSFWDDLRERTAEKHSFLESVDQNKKAVFEAHYEASLAKNMKEIKRIDRESKLSKERFSNSYQAENRDLSGKMAMDKYRSDLLENWRNQEDLWEVQTKDWSQVTRAGRRSFNRNLHPGAKRLQRYNLYQQMAQN